MGSPHKDNMVEAAKKTPAKAAKPKVKPAHPPTASMVVASLKALKEPKGSSLPAIKKYIAANYKVDIVKLSPFIRKALKSLVEKKKLVQTKGTGASGSFKLNKEEKKKVVKKPKAKKPAKKAAKKPAAKKSPKKAAKKAKTPKKAAKKPAVEKKAKAPKKPKSPKKAKAPKKAKSPKKPAKKAAPKKK